MKKTKLIEQRKRKGFSQEKMADFIHITTSAYNRRELGKVPISDDEWERMAKALGVEVDQIFQSESTYNVTVYDNGVGVNNHKVYNLPKEVVEDRTKYIRLLEGRLDESTNHIEVLENRIKELEQELQKK